MTNPTLQDFIDAFEETGITPITNLYYDENINAGCAIGALALANDATPDALTVLRWNDDNLDAGFSAGVTAGFFGVKGVDVEEKNMREGYEIGRQLYNMYNPVNSSQVRSMQHA